MKIPTSLLDATKSRFWLTARTPPVRMAQPTAADDADETPAESAPAYVAPQPTQQRPPRPVSPGDVLLAALDAASDDVQRAALLAAASTEARDGLTHALTYREMTTLAGRNPPLGALVAALDGAEGDTGRAALLVATAPALLVELAEHLRHDRCDAVAQRYMDMLFS